METNGIKPFNSTQNEKILYGLQDFYVPNTGFSFTKGQSGCFRDS